MSKYHTGITAATRDVMKRLGRFRVADVVDGLGTRVQTYHDRKRVKKAVMEFCRRGETKRIERGLYEFAPKIKPSEIQEKMWKVLRVKRSVRIEDLQELAGATQSYAEEWLNMLVKNSIVRRLGNSKYQMIHDPVEMPKNEEKAEKLRQIRLHKKTALEAIYKAGEAVNAARAAIEGIEE